MRRQWTAQHWYLALPAGLLTLSAYFVAAGVSSLVRVWLAPGEPVRPLGRRVLAPRRAATVPSADPILARNPFDSATGPLNATPLTSALPPPPPPPPLDPLHAPHCPETFQVSMTSQDPDPLESVATVRGPGEPKGHLRRVGDTVGDRRVAYIGRSPLEGGPAVWLEGADGLCQTLVFSSHPAAAAATPPAPAPAAPPARQGRRGSGAKLPKHIAKRIQQVAPNTFRVARSALEEIMPQSAQFLRRVRVRPETQGGAVVGFKLSRIRKGTLLDALGLKSGDRVEAVNGFALNGPQAALEAYARLRVADDIRVKATRDGSPLTLEYRVE